jgi:membrane-bound lytic murein transglycosylase MltF
VAPDNLEAEDILEMVNAGLVTATVVDETRAKFWKLVFTKIELHPQAAVRTGGETGWMIRKNSPQLKKALDRLSPAIRKVPATRATRCSPSN